MGQVAFNTMPADIRTPLFFAEFNAGVPAYSGKSNQMLIGHKTAAGAAAIGARIPLGGQDPNYLFGVGSMLADMAAYARRHDPIGDIEVLVVAEPAGAAATATVTFTGAPTAAGTLVRYLAGERLSIPVTATDTPTTIAARFAAAVNAGYTKFSRLMGFPATAAAVAGVVTLTANHAGTKYNEIRIDAGLDGDETDPAGLTIASTAFTGGTGEMDMAAALALLGSARADWIAGPWNSVAQLNAVRDFLSDTAGRWSPTVQLGGHYTTALEGTLSTLNAFGSVRNDAHVDIMGRHNAPHPSWVWAATLNGIIARSKNLGASIDEAIEIARPLQTVLMEGLRPPKSDGDRWTIADRNALYRNGIAGYTVDDSGQVRVDRVVTTYQKTPTGAADITFLDVEDLAISAYVGRYLRNRVETTYPRCVLLPDNPRNLQGVVTPKGAKATMDHAYSELCDAGICINRSLFIQNSIVEQSASPGRLNAYLPAQIASQLRVFAANITITH